jgi:Rrf2 family nitric oxide-sensitive transcriptional repressor
MKLSQHTDYALRLLIHLAVHGDRAATVSEVAGAYGISSHHMAKVAQTLVQGTWVVSARGRGGGLRLARKPAEICVGDVVRHTEASLAIVECFGSEPGCPIEPACKLKHVLSEACDAFLAVLDQHTLADLVRNRRALVPLLIPRPA